MKTKLTKIQKFYIDNNKELSTKQLAKDLKLTEQDIIEYVGVQPSAAPAKRASSISHDLMKDKDAKENSRRKGILIMNKAVSERGDDFLKGAKQNNQYKKDTMKIREE